MERICPRCRRVCFSEAEFADHDCFDADDLINSEIALAEEFAKAPTVEVWTRAQCMVCGRWEACLRLAGIGWVCWGCK